MGNALRSLYVNCCKPSADSDSLTHHPGVSALAHDLYNFEINSQVIDVQQLQFFLFFERSYLGFSIFVSLGSSRTKYACCIIQEGAI